MRVTPIFALLAACATTGPDEPVPPPEASGPAVAPVMPGGSPPPQVACSYREQHDATNDYRAQSGYVLESTGLVFAGSAVTICGQIDSGHFDATDYAIDIDNYGIDLSSEADVIVTLTGSARAISTVGAWLYDPTTSTVPGGAYFIFDHGTFTAHLAAGHYELSVEAYDNGDVAAPVPYTVTIATDHPMTRCAPLATAADYLESFDGPASDGNDMIDVDYSAWPELTLTQSTADASEDMGLTAASGESLRVDGEAAMVAPIGSYLDRDTYVITTGPTTNQLAIRLDWANESADLDYYLTIEGSTFPIAHATTQRLGGGEYAAFAVAPGTRYWLWIGAYATTTSAAPYDATICAETFTP